MTVLSFKDALNRALSEEMERENSVFILGEDIGVYGGAFGVTAGLLDKFGPERVMDTPISEASLAGIASGAALLGMRPVLEIMFMDFTTLIFDQLLNHTVKLKYMFGGSCDIKMPVVIRTPFGGGRAYGASHSQSLEAFFMHVPGLKIVAPSNPADAYSLLKASIRDDNPVMFLENKLLYPETGEVPDREIIGEIGKASVIRSGNNLTVVSYGRMLHLSMKAAEKLENEGWSIEVIDLKSLAPLDKETISLSVNKTGRVVIVEEGTLTGGAGAEISASIMETSFFNLEAPPKRVAALDLPVPYSPKLEESVLPNLDRVVCAIEETLAY
jgi:acetoin:2,6-dichlorophenolindophenol oxidoreductase subunit beta